MKLWHANRAVIPVILAALVFPLVFSLMHVAAGEVQLKPASTRNVVVYKEPGRFAAWPANNGVWTWGNEILVGFVLGYYKANDSGHSIDRTRPEASVLARSLDGGETWKMEDPQGYVGDGAKPLPSPGGIRFNHPDFAMRVGNHTLIQLKDPEGQFFYSYDRGKSWKGPFLFTPFGMDPTSRTDYMAEGEKECLLFLSANQAQVKGGNYRDRAFAARTTDGGKTFQFLGWMAGESVDARSVMPSTVRVSRTGLITALRRKTGTGEATKNWIEAFRSDDNGVTWTTLGVAAETKGNNGNPPSLVRLRDGRLCLTYGYRAVPFGIRARISDSEGKTWGEEIVLRSDARTWDMGYPRTVQRPDGKLVTIYYFTTAELPEQHIAATIWEPPSR